MIGILIAVAVVVILALLLRRGASSVEPIPDEVLDQAGEAPEPDETSDETAAVTSDGWAFIPHGRVVRLVPPAELDEAQTLGPRSARVAPPEQLDVGDFIAARVVRGAAGVDPWRLEVLRRDRDYHAFAFETEEAAAAALDLVEGRIVRPPRDEHGDPARLGPADFEEARREMEASETQLAIEPDDEEIGPQSIGPSTRR